MQEQQLAQSDLRNSPIIHIVIGFILSFVAIIIMGGEDIVDNLKTPFGLVVLAFTSWPFLLYAIFCISFCRKVLGSARWNVLAAIPYLHAVIWIVMVLAVPEAGTEAFGYLFGIYLLLVITYCALAVTSHRTLSKSPLNNSIIQH